jgi:hypothetical protein
MGEDFLVYSAEVNARPGSDDQSRRPTSPDCW